ncbi:MAG: DsbA family oxidoreductase [Nitrospira sp.]|nr:DsbA family oxidoreductase [Nitrospira sp.]
MTETSLTIDIYSDVVCPWCYIGKRRLEQALESVQAQARARVFWRPFQLNPTMPKAGMDRRVYLETKFGGANEVHAIHDRIVVAGVSAGIEFAFGRIARTPNTFDAHRLIWFAQQQGRQDACVEALFHGYFTEGLNVGEADALISLASGAGLDGAAAGRFLQSNDGVEAVRQEEARGRQLGIRGVPYFVLNGKTAVSGAQPVETFIDAISQASA